MGDVKQNINKPNAKGQQKNRMSKSSKNSWWIMKRKKETIKKKPKRKFIAGSEPQKVLTDQTTESDKVNKPVDKKGEDKVATSNNPGKEMSKKARKRKRKFIAGSDSRKVLTDQTTESDKVNKPVDKKGKDKVATSNDPGKVMSKQARKRKLKRQDKTSKKFERKDKLKSDRNVTSTVAAKDKGMDRTDKQLKKRKRQFRKKRQRKTDKEEDGKDADAESTVVMETEGGGGREENKASDGDRDKDVAKIERRGKRSVNKGAEAGAVTSGDMSGDPGTIPEFDSNWRNLMKSINYQPPEKKKKLSKTKDGKPEIWFDDVDPELMEDDDMQGLSPGVSDLDPMHHGKGSPYLLTKGSESSRLTKYVGLDCEMVGIGLNGKENMLARVSIVNQYGLCIYDKFVAPQEEVTNFRSKVTGIGAKDLKNADNFSTVQEEVSSILKGRILVGHALHNDLKVLLLTHPKSMIRDTSTYKKFKEMSKGKMPKLKKLCEKILKVPIQEGEHNSVQDAQAAMKLFMLHRIHWEKELAGQCRRKLKVKTNQEAETLILTSNSLPDTEH